MLNAIEYQFYGNRITVLHGKEQIGFIVNELSVILGYDNQNDLGYSIEQDNFYGVLHEGRDYMSIIGKQFDYMRKFLLEGNWGAVNCTTPPARKLIVVFESGLRKILRISKAPMVEDFIKWLDTVVFPDCLPEDTSSSPDEDWRGGVEDPFENVDWRGEVESTHQNITYAGTPPKSFKEGEYEVKVQNYVQKGDSLTSLEFEGKELTMLEIDGRPCWIAGEIAKALGYVQTSRAVAKITADWADDFITGEDFEIFTGEKLADLKSFFKLTTKSVVSPNTKHLTILYESGVHTLCIFSKTDAGKRFRKWLTREVLPSIRKTGSYSITTTSTDMVPTHSEALRGWANEVDAREREQKQRLLVEAKLKEDKPKVEFAEAVEASEGTMTIGEFAQILSKRGIDIGEKRLFAWMREVKILKKQKGHTRFPYQKYIDARYFEIEEFSYTGNDGKDHISRKTLVTGGGQVWLEKKVRQSGNFKVEEE
jgi:anti-repressor protein